MKLDRIAARAQTANTVGDLFKLMGDIVDYLQERERSLEDRLRSLDSDNITELDFSRTRIKNLPSGGGQG